jgi:hypothetical protein
MAQAFKRSNSQPSRVAKYIRPNALSVSAKAEYRLSQPQRKLAFWAQPLQARTAICPPRDRTMHDLAGDIFRSILPPLGNCADGQSPAKQMHALSDRSTTQLLGAASQTAQGSSGRAAGQFGKTWRNRPRRLIMNMQALLFRQKRRGAFDAARRALRPLRPLDGHVFGPAV